MITWSYGGGVQSACIAVLIAQGKLPKPDYIVMADTGREASETWEYTGKYIKPLFESLGLKLTIIPHSYATVDFYSASGKALIPAYTNSGNGKLPTFCSVKWKQRPVRRWMREQGIRQSVLWMGISLDEIDRMRISDVKWIENHYPLVFDVPMRRFECVKLVEKFGLPTPPRSSCWMCPNRSNEEWLRLQHYLDDWNHAVKVDQEIWTAYGARLHQTCQPLDQVDFTAVENDQLDFCAIGFCMV
jgi:hypothetical protein